MQFIAWISKPWPVATFVHYVYTLKITDQLRWLGLPLIIIFHVWPANPPTITSVALCHGKFGHPWFVDVLKMCPYTKLHIPRCKQ